jgi:hypothetical protein
MTFTASLVKLSGATRRLALGRQVPTALAFGSRMPEVNPLTPVAKAVQSMFSGPDADVLCLRMLIVVVVSPLSDQLDSVGRNRIATERDAEVELRESPDIGRKSL